jgi:hypothetical protein
MSDRFLAFTNDAPYGGPQAQERDRLLGRHVDRADTAGLLVRRSCPDPHKDLAVRGEKSSGTAIDLMTKFSAPDLRQ